MNCYECLTQDQQTTPAVAICSQCGAAACLDHTRTGHAYTEIHSPGAGHLREAPGRRLYCATCGARTETSSREATASTVGVGATS